MAERMHTVRHTELRRQSLQIFPIVANADQRVVCVDARLLQEWKGTDHVIEALSALQPPDGKNKALTLRDTDARSQVVGGEAGPEAVFVHGWIDDGDAPGIHVEQAGQCVAG